MIRFMPTASGPLHIGHIGSLLAIQEFAKRNSISKVYLIIDDMQIMNWNLYEKKYTDSEIKLNVKNTQDVIKEIFPDVISLGSYTDIIYENRRECIFNDLLKNGFVKRFEYDGKEFAIPINAYSESENGNPLFNVLHCFKKRDIGDDWHWNPFYAHEVIDCQIETKYQIIDSYLSCPFSYLYDDHTHSIELWNFWASVIGKSPTKRFIHPRVVGVYGEEISKTSSEDRYSVYPLETLKSRCEKAYFTEWDSIGSKLLDCKGRNFCLSD